MWQQASRLALNLASFRVLARPFAPTSTAFPHIKYLHDDTKKPDSQLGTERKDPSDDDAQPNLEVRDLSADMRAGAEDAAFEKHRHNAKPTAVRKVRRTKTYTSEAKRAASHANLHKFNEAQRAAGFPHLRKMREDYRAAGFPGAKKAAETRRAAGCPGLAKAREVLKATGHIQTTQGRRVRVHADLIRDIEAANKRKLAEDPTFIPVPLPIFESKPRVVRRNRPERIISCPEPGCMIRFPTEKSLAIHIRRMHGGYNEKTPHKCEDPSCDLCYETERQARAHFRSVHGKLKSPCPVCDREFDRRNLKRHLLELHGIGP